MLIGFGRNLGMQEKMKLCWETGPPSRETASTGNACRVEGRTEVEAAEEVAAARSYVTLMGLHFGKGLF